MKKQIGHKILVFLLAIIIFMGFPIFVILTIPLIIFRFIVKNLALYLNRKLGKMVTTRGCAYAADDYTNYPTSNVITATILEGQVSKLYKHNQIFLK